MNLVREKSSFRDPSGYLFWQNNKLFRRINHSYSKDYRFLIDSGFYQNLVDRGLLVSHKEVKADVFEETCFKIIEPEILPFISYPYEWSFSQLKDAALLTLEIQKKALSFGMILKDCSAYNVQFKNGRPIFIDTLSFEIYEEGKPWIAYKQFCQHFLAPLALMSLKDVRLNQLLKTYIDGIPLDLASSLLPIKSRFRLSLLLHIHLHAKSQKRYEDKIVSTQKLKRKISLTSLRGLIDSLESGAKSLKWKPTGTEWVDYYQDDSYTREGFEDKKKLVSDYLDIVKPKLVWDLGANDGVFSRIAQKKGAFVVSSDVDPACVENNYLCVKKNKYSGILPFLIDLTNPSPGIGWDSSERMSLKKRGPVDVVMALALVHHLAISNSVPLGEIARFFSDLCYWLIVEFIPKQDKKVQKLLSTREDIFPNYTKEGFEKEFCRFFNIEILFKIKDSNRILYLMKKNLQTIEG